MLKDSEDLPLPSKERVIAVVDRKIVSTLTGEVLVDLGGRNSRPSPSKAIDQFDRTTIIGAGRRPRTTELPANYHNGPWAYWCPHAPMDMWLCGVCNNGFERTDGGKVKKATEAQLRAMAARPDIVWHYKAPAIWFGRCPESHDYTLERGRVTRVYSLNQRRDALKLVAEYGLTAASRKCGIPRTTLKNWQVRAA